MLKNIVETSKPQVTIWRIRITFWITKATNTHLKYVIFVAWTHPNVTLQVHFPSCYFLQRLYFRLGSIIQNRQAKLWLQPDWLFRWTSMYKNHENCIKILHGFSYKVRRNRVRMYLWYVKVKSSNYIDFYFSNISCQLVSLFCGTLFITMFTWVPYWSQS
jgi:hypothetical protein